MKKIGFIGIILLVFIADAIALYARSNSVNVKSAILQSRKNMVYIPGGTYTMGPSNPDWRVSNTYPPHKVILASFYISKYNVSYGEYDVYSKDMKLPYIDVELKKLNDVSRQANCPVDGVTWFQANNYCQWLRKKTGLPYDLPTEAQWEYVARALGKKNWPFPTNNGKQELCKNFPCDEQYENQKGNVNGDFFALPVGSLPRTPQGIYGMTGEVNQWLKDWYDHDYYKHSPVNNPQGPKQGTKKVIRGAGVNTDSHDFAHNFARYGVNPNKRWAGFRCVINSDVPPDKLGAYAK